MYDSVACMPLGPIYLNKKGSKVVLPQESRATRVRGAGDNLVWEE